MKWKDAEDTEDAEAEVGGLAEDGSKGSVEKIFSLLKTQPRNLHHDENSL